MHVEQTADTDTLWPTHALDPAEFKFVAVQCHAVAIGRMAAPRARRGTTRGDHRLADGMMARALLAASDHFGPARRADCRAFLKRFVALHRLMAEPAAAAFITGSEERGTILVDERVFDVAATLPLARSDFHADDFREAVSRIQ